MMPKFMEKFIKSTLSQNQINKMLFLIIICFVLNSLTNLKYKENNKHIIELINTISKI